MSAKISPTSNTKLTFDRVRLSYAQLHTPKQKTDAATGQPVVDPVTGKPVLQFSTALLIPKSDTQAIDLLKQAMTAAAKAKFGDKIPPKWGKGLRDGDTDEAAMLDPLKPELGPKPEYKDHFWVNCTAPEARPPIVISKDKDEFTGEFKKLSQAEIKSGDYVRAQINCYGYDVGVNKGVAFGVLAVQLVEVGEALAGGGADMSAFEDELEEAF